jgi:hypothetical protein
MATVRKRKWQKGDEEVTAWVADYSDQNGKRHIKTFALKRDANRFLAGIEDVAEQPEASRQGSGWLREMWRSTVAPRVSAQEGGTQTFVGVPMRHAPGGDLSGDLNRRRGAQTILTH